LRRRGRDLYARPKGKKLGRVVDGQPATARIGFGGDELKTLFFTSLTQSGSVDIKIAGNPGATRKRGRGEDA
jgi:sugar lactone lactonase YvrE